MTLAEICIASGVGARIEHSTDLFGEDPHRVLAVFEPGTVTLPTHLARRVGVIGGENLVLGPDTTALPVDQIASAWHNAIPRALGV